MSVLGGKRTLADAVGNPSTGGFRILLTLTVTFRTYDADAPWHLNRAFDPIAAMAL